MDVEAAREWFQAAGAGAGFAVIAVRARASVLRSRRRGHDELRAILREMRTVFQDVIAVPHREASYYLDAQRRDHDQDLADVLARVTPGRLRRIGERVVKARRSMFANAPARPGRRDAYGAPVWSPADFDRFERQVVAARDGLEALTEATDYMNRLARRG